jgi:hypothetical protein
MLSTIISALPAVPWPEEQWPAATPAELGLDETKLTQARDYALTGEGSGCIIIQGKQVMNWGDQTALYDLKSSSKSIGLTVLGLALKDGKVKLDDPAKKHHPTFGVPPETNAQTGWIDKITLRMLANQTACFAKAGGYEPLLFEPGTKWNYSDGGPNWLAECLTLVYGRDLNDILFERVFTPIGINSSDIRWRKHQYRPDLINGIKRREFGSGFSANVQAMSRIGYLYLREGRWNNEQILPREFIEAVRKPPRELAGLPVNDESIHGNASAHYGLLWWNNADGNIAGLPRDAYWSWGLYDSLIVVAPSLDLVVARAGKSWKRTEGVDHYDVLKPFLEPIAASVRSGPRAVPARSGDEGALDKRKPENPSASEAAGTAPPPSLSPRPTKGEGDRRQGDWKSDTADAKAVHSNSPSPVIKRITWAPTSEILRLAKGSDNWPMTWADDDALYTAYGDGHGFEPFVPEKLSLGVAKVLGNPPDIKGINLRSSTAEGEGDDRRGRKASGLLMVDSVLYLLARNVGNAQLAWSTDHGTTWMWADWKFTNSFGCPTFVNFGCNYSSARDDFVYICSHDTDSAYERADQMVLARVPKDKLRVRDAYEFFVRLDKRGDPLWTRDIAQRGAMFADSGRCYRSSISYNAVIKRYLWCQTGTGADTRFAGGFALFDGPEPWGPWTTVFQTEHWDVGPGEMQHLPTKWMSTDGCTVWLVFSGEDCFSVRRAVLEIAR